MNQRDEIEELLEDRTVAAETNETIRQQGEDDQSVNEVVEFEDDGETEQMWVQIFI